MNVKCIAPSGKINREKFLAGKSFLETLFALSYSDAVFSAKRNMAGTDQDRLDDLVSGLTDPNVQVLWAIRGGFGATRVLPMLPKDLPISSDKVLIGYSDITAYQLCLYHYYGLKSISGPMVQVDFPMERDAVSFRWMLDFLNELNGRFMLPKHCKFFNAEKLEGILLGGCLSVITQLIGTPFLPSFKNKLLFLEDVNEHIYRIDGYFSHLKNAGLLNDISGIVLGQFSPPESITDTTQYSSDLGALIYEYFIARSIPVLMNFPIGHFQGTYPLPIGYNVCFTHNTFYWEK